MSTRVFITGAKSYGKGTKSVMNSQENTELRQLTGKTRLKTGVCEPEPEQYGMFDSTLSIE